MQVEEDGKITDGQSGEDSGKPEKWFVRLKSGLQKSRQNLATKVAGVFSRFSPGSEEFWEEVEAVLIQADVGVSATTKIVDNLRKGAKEKECRPLRTFFLCWRRDCWIF